MTELLEQSDLVVQRVSLTFTRFLHEKIDWSHRLIGIKGARGTGKTMLLLQWLSRKGLPASRAAYFSLDNLYFSNNTLADTGKSFFKQGGQILALDEVHKYPGWAQEIKNLYDLYPELQIIFTGSSIIDISKQEGDLSRRAQMYELPGLSFREYLKFIRVLDAEAVPLQRILDKEYVIRKMFPENFRPLQHFRQYLESGYYPFFTEASSGYPQRLQQVIRTIVEYDMAEIEGFDVRNAKKLLQLLYIIAQNVPFKPNISKLSEKSNMHRNSLPHYLHYLEQARLIRLLQPSGISIATLRKPEKLYLNNTNFSFALSSGEPSTGTLRETFFYSQMEVDHRVRLPKKGDFEIDGKYIFEIGGKGKDERQIKGGKKAWVVKDDLEYPAGNALPLWIFGFVY